MKKKMNKKGFTLMEMLIVVAIIAVLVAIAIPTFTSSLTKAKQAADNANVRAAYAEVMSKVISEGGNPSITVNDMQADYDNTTKIGSITPNPAWGEGGTATVTASESGGNITVTITGTQKAK